MPTLKAEARIQRAYETGSAVTAGAGRFFCAIGGRSKSKSAAANTTAASACRVNQQGLKSIEGTEPSAPPL